MELKHTKMCKELKCLKISVTVDFFQGVLKYGSQFGTIFYFVIIHSIP